MPGREGIAIGSYCAQHAYGEEDNGKHLHDDQIVSIGCFAAVLASALVNENEIYSVIGEDGFQRLVAAFYKQVPDDDVLGPLYQGRDLAAAEQRLREFLIFRFGGPERYVEQRGHPRLRMRHAPFPVDQTARDRWLQLMSNALAEARLPEEAEQILRSYFESTATFMMNRQ